MGNLVLDSLEIQGFRGFQHLQIEKLGRVNLIVGKNNVGKTSLLEALSLYAHEASPSFIWELLRIRDESTYSGSRQFRNIDVKSRLSHLKYLFYGRKDIRKLVEPISIGPIGSTENKQGVNNLKKGFDNLLASLDVELDRSGLRCLGVVIDADNNCKARWQSLRDRLIAVGYANIQPDPDPGGTIITQEGRPTVGIWLMPDNSSSGAIEDFVGSLIPSDDIIWSLAGETIQKLVEIVEHDVDFQHLVTTETHYQKVYGSHTEKINQSGWQSKARIRTWLALQKEPGGPMGSAIKNRYVDANMYHAQQLIAWLCKLFGIELV